MAVSGGSVGEVYVDVMARADKVDAQVTAAFEQAGAKAGEAFTLGADGRLSDSRGKFVKAGADSGESFGQGFGDSVSTAVERETSSGGFLSKLSDIGGKIAKGIGIGVAAGGALVGAAVVKGLTESMSMEAGNDKLAAQLGLGAEQAGKFGKIAGDLYSGAWGDSMETVNDALVKITRNIGEGNAEWTKNTAATALDFTTAFEQDMSRTTQAIGTLLNTGMAKSSEEAFDILTKGMQLGVDKGEDLLDTFIEYPSVLNKLGLDATTAMGLLNQGLSSGARNADVVADALKEFQIRATDSSKTSAEGYALIGLNAQEMTAKIAKGGDGAKEGLQQVLDGLRNMEDPVARNTAAVALFGTKAEDMGDALWALDPSQAVATMGAVGGAAKAMGDTLNDNAATRIESFKRQALMGLTTIIGDHVLPMFERFVGWIETTVVPIIQNISAVFGEFGFGVEGVGAVIQNTMVMLLESFGVSEATAIEWGDRIADAFFRVVEVVRQAFDTVRSIFEAAVAAISWVWENFGENITRIVELYLGYVARTVGNILDVVQGIFEVFAGLFTGDWSRMWEGIQQVFGAVWDQILNMAGLFLGLLREAFDIAMKALGMLLSAAWDAIRNNWDEALMGLFQAAVFIFTVLPGKLAELALSGMRWVIDKAMDGLNTLWGKLDDWAGEFAGWLGRLPGRLVLAALAVGDAIGSGIRYGLGFIWAKLEEWGTSFLRWVLDLPGKIAEAALNLGRIIVEKIAEGIRSFGGAISGALGGILSSVPGGSLVSRGLGAILAEGGNVVPIDAYAMGGTHRTPGGLALVGELGPELVQFGGNAAVFPTHQFQRELAALLGATSGGGGTTIIEASVSGDARRAGRRFALGMAQGNLMRGVAARAMVGV